MRNVQDSYRGVQSPDFQIIKSSGSSSQLHTGLPSQYLQIKEDWVTSCDVTYTDNERLNTTPNARNNRESQPQGSNIRENCDPYQIDESKLSNSDLVSTPDMSENKKKARIDDSILE